MAEEVESRHVWVGIYLFNFLGVGWGGVGWGEGRGGEWERRGRTATSTDDMMSAVSSLSVQLAHAGQAGTGKWAEQNSASYIPRTYPR